MNKIPIFIIIILITSGLVFLYLISNFRVVTVNARSMEPSFKQGSTILVKKVRSNQEFSPEQVILHYLPRSAYHTEEEFNLFKVEEYVHRIQSIEKNGLFVSSDNEESADSDQWGIIPFDSVTGIVVSCLSRCN